jgi:hypothetical protein
MDAKTREALLGALPFPKSGFVKFTPEIEGVSEEFCPVFVLTQPTKDDADINFKPAYNDVVDIDEAIAKQIKIISNAYDFDSGEFIEIKDDIAGYLSKVSESLKVSLFLKIRTICRVSVYEKAGLGQ